MTFTFILAFSAQGREWSQLAPNNQLVAEAMRALLFIFQYYNKYPGFEGDKFEMLDNKVWYCEELLSLYSKLWPGRNYPAVMVEYEQLHATLPLLELQAEDGATREELEMSLDNLMEVGLGAKDMLAREPDLTLYRQLSQFTLQVACLWTMVLGCGRWSMPVQWTRLKARLWNGSKV